MDARIKSAHDEYAQYTRAFGGMYCTSLVMV
jgi:hypothetical protein